MTQQKPLTLAIILSLSATLGACGGGGSDNNMPDAQTNQDRPTPTKPAPLEPTKPETDKLVTSEPGTITPTDLSTHDTDNALPTVSRPTQPAVEIPVTTSGFTPADQALVSLSTSRESTFTGINNGHAVAPVSEPDRELIDKVLAETNAIRKEVGVAPLKYDENLAAFAQQRANEITQKYEHERPDGRDALSDLTHRKGGSAGENIYQSPRTPEAAVQGWKESPGHYKNMVNENYQRIGIGLVRKPNTTWDYYWTQVFAGGDIGSKYHFDPKLSAKRPDFGNYLAEHINKDQSTGAISLIGGDSFTNTTANAYQKGQLSQTIYANNRRFQHDGFSAVIQTPSQADFSYQTFGEIIDKDNIPVQYVNIGQPTVPDDTAQFQATYHGSSIGNRNQRSRYYADVTAKVDYGPRRKVMDITFSNTRFAPDDISKNNPDTTVWLLKEDERNPQYNFKEQLTWSSQDKRFSKTDEGGSHIHAAFYGNHGEEIGGQFTRVISGHEVYEGVFGAKNEAAQ